MRPLHPLSACVRRVTAPCAQLVATALLVALTMAGSPATAAADPLSPAMQAGQTAADTKLALTESATAANRYPFYTQGDAWLAFTNRGWTSGFLSGSHWLDYQRTGDAAALAAARRRQSTLTASATDTTQHDIGFMLLSSYGQGYRITGDASYKSVLMTAAKSLATRYDAAVRSVRTRNTPEDFWVYNDTMMNIELLFWGADNGGGAAMREMARNHALRCAADFLRPDGGSYHYVVYSEKTGAVLDKGQGQGYAKESTWSRGQAWIIYGMAVAYRETGDARLLDAAHRATDYWVANVPADLVPYWDFDAPNIPDEPRDSSAAAAAASAFIELSRIDPDPERRAAYLDLATRTLDSLSSPAYLAPDTNPAVLAHGTYAAMIGAADHGTSWGDYYYREALMRYRTQVRRVAGPDRYAVSVRASQTGFEHADAVVIASGAVFPDALAASSLAGALDAPVLLTGTDSLSPGVAGEIARLGATEVVVIGGPRSVAENVLRQLRALPGTTVSRISGADRYEVAVRVADEVERRAGSPAREVYVVRGDTFADALSVSPLAYARRAPVLLTRPDTIPDCVEALLGRSRPETVTVVGGTVSVAPSVAARIGALTGTAPSRIAGPDRYWVSGALAQAALSEKLAEPAFFGVANGTGFADALSGGAVAGSRRGVMLLSPGSSLHPAAGGLLPRWSSSTSAAWIFGGEASVTGRAENDVKNALPEQ